MSMSLTLWANECPYCKTRESFDLQDTPTNVTNKALADKDGPVQVYMNFYASIHDRDDTKRHYKGLMEFLDKFENLGVEWFMF